MKITIFYKTLFLLTILLISTGFSHANEILIINSDNSAYKYQENADEFKKTLKKNGYQWTEFDLANHSNNSDEEIKNFIEKNTDSFIYCIGSRAYSLARSITQGKKILFSAVINWRRLGVSEETYGVANELAPEQEISLLRYFFPSVKKIGLLFNEKFSLEYIERIKKIAVTLDVEIIEESVDDAGDIEDALEDLLPKIDLFWIISDPVVLNSKESVQKIFSMTKEQQKPVYAYSDVFIAQGAMLAISADIATIGRQSANLIMMMNEKPPTSTVQIPAGSTITLNKCIVDALHINFNQDALDSVNKLVNCNQNE